MKASQSFSELTIISRAEWRAWLFENHKVSPGVWLVYFKKGTGHESIEYEASVEEALCFGWVDSIIKKLDDVRYARKFTPRTESSRWSEHNKKRVKKMIAAGRMAPAGMHLVEAAKQNGMWEQQVSKPQLTFAMLPEFVQALQANPDAYAFFNSLSVTNQKQFLGWIEIAKRLETRQRRIAESIDLLNQGKNLGLR